MVKIRKRNKSPSFKNSIKYLKKGDWEKLRSSIDNYRDKLIITLLYSTGMRVGEFTKLRVEDIDFEERFIRIPPQRTLRLEREGLSLYPGKC